MSRYSCLKKVAADREDREEEFSVRLRPKKTVHWEEKDDEEEEEVEKDQGEDKVEEEEEKERTESVRRELAKCQDIHV